MPDTGAGRPFPTRLWLGSLLAILAIAAAGIVINHVEGASPSPVTWRLAAAGIVTVAVASAKIVAGTRAAAVTGVVGTAVAVGLLILLA